MQKTRLGVGAAGLLLAAMSLSGCTLRFDFTECRNDADCRPLEADGVFYTCASDQCVPDTTIECRADGDCASAETCTDGQCVGGTTNNNDLDMGAPDTGPDEDMRVPDMSEPDMREPDMAPSDQDGDGVPDATDNCPMLANADQVDIDQDGIGDACDPEVRVPCATSSECAGDTEVCIESFCTELTSTDCTTVLGEPKAASALRLGVILPMTAPYQNLGPPLAKSIELALVEANRAGGLPGGERVSAVVCNDVGSSVVAQRAARHLVDVVKVPGIIGPIFSTPFTDVVTQVTRAAGVLTITPAATAPSLSTLQDDGLAFRMLASDVFQAKAIAARLRALNPSGVTIFVKDDAYGDGLFNALSTEINSFLQANQRTSVKYEDPATFGFDVTQIQMEFAQKIGTAVAARPNPDVAVFIGTSEVVNLALGYAGAILQGGNPAPRLLFSHGAIADMPNIAGDATLGSTLNPLTEGVGPNIFNGVNFANYNQRFALEFPGEPNLTISTLTYDATAVMFFAAAAVPVGTEITGTAMAANIPRISDKAAGTEVAAGNATFLSQGFALLAAGDNFDFVGTSGDVDFDANGDVLTDFLRFINVPAMPSGWTIGTNAVFPIALGIWIDQCGGGRPACGTGFSCEPTNGICLPQCDQAAGTCPHPALTCIEDGNFDGVGICVPPPS